jgi:hypothetical protein
MSIAGPGCGLDFSNIAAGAVGTAMENREPLPGVDANLARVTQPEVPDAVIRTDTLVLGHSQRLLHAGSPSARCETF